MLTPEEQARLAAETARQADPLRPAIARVDEAALAWLLSLVARLQQRVETLDKDCGRYLGELVTAQNMRTVAEAERDTLRAQLTAAQEALQDAYSELWATYGDSTRLRPLFDRLEAAIKVPTAAPPPEREP